MSVLVNKNSKVLVAGMTGREGSFHTGQMIEYGTNVVAGVTPGKGGQNLLGVPIFDTAEEAVQKTGADAALIFVPAPSPPTASLSVRPLASLLSASLPKASRSWTQCGWSIA